MEAPCTLVFLPEPGSTNSQRPWGIYSNTSLISSLVTQGTTVYQSIGLRDGAPEFLFHLVGQGWVLGPLLALETGAGVANVSATLDTNIMDTGTWTSGVRVWCLEAGDHCTLAGRDAGEEDVRDQFEVFFYGKPSVNRPAPYVGR